MSPEVIITGITAFATITTTAIQVGKYSVGKWFNFLEKNADRAFKQQEEMQNKLLKIIDDREKSADENMRNNIKGIEKRNEIQEAQLGAITAMTNKIEESGNEIKEKISQHDLHAETIKGEIIDGIVEQVNRVVVMFETLLGKVDGLSEINKKEILPAIEEIKRSIKEIKTTEN